MQVLHSISSSYCMDIYLPNCLGLGFFVSKENGGTKEIGRM